MQRELFEYLQSYLTESRWTRMREVLALRTRHIAVVLDDVYQPHNTSAAIRSCDAFGIQDVYLVEREHKAELSSPVAAGTDKWLTLRCFRGDDAPCACAATLRSRGYRVLVTVPNEAAATPETLDLAKPVAIVIGSEKSGVSDEMLAAADERLAIPMFGFVDSFNLSVATALCLQDLTRRLRASEVDWRLTDEEHDSLLFEWTRSCVPNVDSIVARWQEEHEPSTDLMKPE